MERNLWGNLKELENDVSLPEVILEEQAEYLNESLYGLVKCRVMRISQSKEWKEFYKDYDVMSDFSYSARIFSDYVEKYEYEICKVTYGIKMYPLAISFGTGIAEEVKKEFDVEDEDTVFVYYEEELINVLQKILSSREVHQVLKGLVSIAKKEKASLDCLF